MSKQAKHFYEFDSFRVDVSERVLFHDGEPIYLPPKVFDTLLGLLEHSGHIVEKEELIKQVWPDTFVEESNLTQYISVLRRTLGDERHKQRLIETVPRRGYRFSAGVREVWEENGELVGATHTKVSLVVKKEMEEQEDSETRRHSDTGTGRDEETASVTASPRRRVVALLALTALVVGAAAGAFGLYQFIGQRGTANESRVATGAAATQAFAIKAFDPAVWPRTDADIGVAGFVIEDFEDATLAQGLRIELSDSTDDNFGPADTLPMVFDPNHDDWSNSAEEALIYGVWDGPRVLINRRTRPPSGYEDFAWGDVTFHIPGGATSFGFSLQSMELTTELFVNGIFQGRISSLLTTGSARNGYLRIDARPGDTIFSVSVANGANLSTTDGLVFDHVAFNPLQRQCAPIPPRLVSWHPGEGGANSNPSGHYGIIQGPVSFPAAKVGQGFHFDSNEEHVSIPHHPNLNVQATGFSAEFWMKGIKNQPHGQYLVVDKSHGFIDSRGWLFQGMSTNGKIFFGLGAGGESLINFLGVESTVDVLDGQFHHIAGTWDGSMIRLYLDGALQGSTPFTAPVNNKREVSIGYSWGGGKMQRFFRGIVDELGIYDRALTQEEIARINNAGSSGKCHAASSK